MATRKKPTNETGKPAAASAYGGVPIGSSGLKQVGGYISEEPVVALSGLTGIRTYRQMSDMDDTIGAVLFAITMLVRGVEWTVQPVSDAPEHEDAAGFIDEVIEDMAVGLADVMDEVCSMFIYGFAPMEIVFKARSKAGGSKFTDNKIGIKGLYLRSQDTIVKWLFNESNDDILGLVQQPWGRAQVEIPAEFLLLFRTTRAKGNPQGRSILRNAYRNWQYKKRIQEIEGIGVERDLAGLPVGKVPIQLFSKNASADEKAVFATWQEMVTKVRRDQAEGLLIPSTRDASGNPLYEFQLLSTGGTRAFDTGKIIDRYDRGMATTVLADFIFLGQNAVGSFALSSDKTALFATAVGGFLQVIEDTLNRGVVDRLWSLNGFDEATKPRLKAGDLEHANISEVGQFLTAMAGAGAQLFPDRPLENALRTMAGLPPAPEESDPASMLEARYPGFGGDGGDDAGGADANQQGQKGAGNEQE